MTRLIYSLIAIAGAAAPSDACPRMDPADVAITPDGGTVYDTGGVITMVSWSFGQKESALHVEGSVAKAVAPLLTVWSVPAGANDVDIRDGSGKTAHHYTVAAAPPALAAPQVKLVSSTAASQKALALTYPGMPAMTAVLELATPAPDDAYALIVYEGTDARSWVAVTKDKTSYTIQTGGKGCYGSAVSPMWQGETLRFAWLDKGGRVSAQSKPLVVRKP